jgi:hypothetical protein
LTGPVARTCSDGATAGINTLQISYTSFTHS